MIPIRYMDVRWIDDFFVNGRLMLTTYDKCRAHEDLTRRDEREGKGNFLIKDSVHAIAGIQTMGRKSYLLCTSLLESTSLMIRFATDDYFRIIDIESFCSAIATSLPGCLSYKYDRCKYVTERAISRDSLNFVTPDFTALLEAVNANDQRKVEKAFYGMNEAISKRIDSEISDDIYFLKEDRFSVEDEFRMIWIVEADVSGPRVIECPKAIAFCQRR